MKEALLKGELSQIGQLLDTSWQHKKNMAEGISNNQIDAIYSAVMKAGALGGKMSGAGGGGFMIFFAEPEANLTVKKALAEFNGTITRFEFCNEGLTTWTINE